MQQELLDLLVARQGHFRFESGHHSNRWLDLDQLFLHPDAVQPFAVELARRFSTYHVAAVCGPLVGGALLAQTIAVELGVEFYYTERILVSRPDSLYPIEYRLPKSLCRSIHGKSVAIIDDVMSAGSAVRGTLAALQACGAMAVVTGALLVLGELASSFFAAQNIPVESIVSLSSAIWTPAECPLCAAQVPLEDMTGAGV